MRLTTKGKNEPFFQHLKFQYFFCHFLGVLVVT